MLGLRFLFFIHKMNKRAEFCTSKLAYLASYFMLICNEKFVILLIKQTLNNDIVVISFETEILSLNSEYDLARHL